MAATLANDGPKRPYEVRREATARRTPVDLAIDVFGGASALADALGVHPSQIYRWRGASLRRRAGFFPRRVALEVVAISAQRGLGLTAPAIVHGVMS